MIFRKETKKTAETNFVNLFRIDFGDLLPLGSLDLRLVIAKRIESQQRQLTKPADNTRGLMPFSVCLPTPTKRKRKIEKQKFFYFMWVPRNKTKFKIISALFYSGCSAGRKANTNLQLHKKLKLNNNWARVKP